jgi:hypothetical protein
LYPTPLLHLEPTLTAPTADLGSLQFQALLRDFLGAHQQVHDAQRRLDVLSRRLSDWFEQAGIDAFHTPMGLLTRTEVGGKPVFQLQV